MLSGLRGLSGSTEQGTLRKCILWLRCAGLHALNCVNLLKQMKLATHLAELQQTDCQIDTHGHPPFLPVLFIWYRRHLPAYAALHL